MPQDKANSDQSTSAVDDLRGLKRSHTAIYIGIALDSLGMAEKAGAVRDAAAELSVSSEDSRDDYFARMMVAGRAQQQHIASAIVFAALCIEAIINFVLDHKLTKFFVSGLDKLDPTTKWVVGLKIAYAHDLSCDSALATNIKKLVTYRNRLAHAKPRTVVDEELNPVPDETCTIDVARFAVATAQQAIRYLHELDPSLREWDEVRLTTDLA